MGVIRELYRKKDSNNTIEKHNIGTYDRFIAVTDNNGNEITVTDSTSDTPGQKRKFTLRELLGALFSFTVNTDDKSSNVKVEINSDIFPKEYITSDALSAGIDTKNKENPTYQLQYQMSVGTGMALPALTTSIDDGTLSNEYEYFAIGQYNDPTIGITNVEVVGDTYDIAAQTFQPLTNGGVPVFVIGNGRPINENDTTHELRKNSFVIDNNGNIIKGRMPALERAIQDQREVVNSLQSDVNTMKEDFSINALHIGNATLSYNTEREALEISFS